MLDCFNSCTLESNQIKIKMAQFEVAFERKPSTHYVELKLNYASATATGQNFNYEISEQNGINGTFSIYSNGYRLKIRINDVKNLSIKATDVLINDKRDQLGSFNCNGNEWSAHSSERIRSIKRSIILSFEESEAQSIRKDFNDIFANSTLENDTKSEMKDKFTVVAQDKNEFEFEKGTLCLLSPVLKRMIENPETIEAKSNKVEINNFSSKTIETFQALLNKSDSLKKENFTAELVMFADYYLIRSLSTVCEKHSKITKENALDFTKAGYFTNNKEILKAVVEFFRENKLTLDEEWKEFQKNYPEGFIKLMNLLHFVE